MEADKINRMIESAINDEEKTGRLASTVKSVARQNGDRLTDQHVGITITQNMMGQVMNRILSSGFAFNSSPDPVWGNASIDQIVVTQMGAMGIV